MSLSARGLVCVSVMGTHFSGSNHGIACLPRIFHELSVSIFKASELQM